MITTMLQGGLGNQLFQYAFGLSQSRLLDTELILDISLLQRDSMRQYNLGLFRGVTERQAINSVATVNEKTLRYDQELADSIKDGDVLRGYWQCERYFSRDQKNASVKYLLLEKLEPKQGIPQLYYPTIERQIRAAGDRSTFLTIRRTDYVQKQDFHGVLPIEYYNKALDIIARNLGGKPEIFVFSDEPEWCKRNLDFYPYSWTVAGTYDQTTPTSLGREDLDLWLMSLCNNAVMANSSF